MARDGVDVIHGHSTKASLLAATASRLTGVPSVYTPHAWAFDRAANPMSRVMYAAFERAMGRVHRKIIAVADAERQLAKRAGVGRDQDIRVVMTGLPNRSTRLPRTEARAVLAFADEEVVVAWVGRRARQKRPQDLAPLARALGVADIRLVALGYGIEGSREGAELVAAGGRILPQQTDPGILYAAADDLVQASAWEGTSLAVLEAMAAGLPVVAYSVGGLPQQVENGLTGHLVEPGSIEMLAAWIVELARSPRERALAGMAAREKLDRDFNFERMIDSIQSVYHSVGAQAATPGRHDGHIV
jgi:glycosyltransferase involved in cell wall biosynthesis